MWSANHQYGISLLETPKSSGPIRPTESIFAFNKIPGNQHTHVSLGSQGPVIMDVTWTEEYAAGWQ